MYGLRAPHRGHLPLISLFVMLLVGAQAAALADLREDQANLRFLFGDDFDPRMCEGLAAS